MTCLTDTRPVSRRISLGLGDGWALLGLALGATFLTMLMSLATAAFVLRGGFGDPDDAMRLVEVRAWMAGQAWLDVSAHRLDPTLGASMHWSRLVDLPMAAAIRLFDLFADPVMAERWVRIAVPTFWLVALYVGMGRLADLLVGRAGRVPAILGTLLSGAALISFLPGRIGHHAPETVVLVFAVGAALASLEAARARQAALAGVLVALGLAMSLETLPFLAALCVAMVAAWVARGARLARALIWFGLGLGLALPALFLATVAPGRWLAPSCDAFGAAHLGAGMIGAGGAVLMAWASPAMRSWPRRLGAAALVGALVLVYVTLAYPACLRSPFAGVDPLVRGLWLDRVVESKPLLTFLRDRPMIGLAIVGPVALGLVAALNAAFATRGTTRQRFMIVAGLAGLGLTLGFWQVRVFASVTPLALCGGLHVVTIVRAHLAKRGLGLAAAFAPALMLPFTSTAWAIALPEDAMPVNVTAPACLAPEALAPLAMLPPGRAVAPINLGSHLLVATPLDVFAAPYHRNNDGNLFMMHVFLAAPDAAQELLASRGAAYVLICGGETASLAAMAPAGLAARLRAGDIPSFLQRVPLAGTPYAVYRVAPGG